jgi:hypothetical protein
MKPSKSPQRHTFQKGGYVKRQTEKGEPVNEDYLDYFQKIIEDHNRKFDDPRSRENNLEWDLLTTDWILEKVRESDSYAQNLYAAMCNVEWQSKAFWPTLKEQRWGCSWRYAGGIIADMQQKGDYIDWYCSGIAGGDEPDVYGQGLDLQRKKYVPEGTVTEEIERDLDRLGWIPVPYKD